jgi:4-amino-4-deoxy-L-arabinose transferase-like glycosyltransferase
MKSKNLAIYISLFVIIVAASFLRLYKLDQVPPSLSWDEVDVGYNAYTIAYWGKDEWGVRFPIVFKSFEDYKHPVHIYLTSLSVLLGGLNDFSVRLPAAIFGVLNVLLIYFLAKELFKSQFLGIVSSAVLAISPYNIQFSRFNHELNFTIFFFMLALLLFYKAINKKPQYLIFSTISFIICFISYHSAKPIVVVTSLLLFILYAKSLLKMKKQILMSSFFILLLFWGVYKNPQLLGLARLNQTSVSKEEIEEMSVYKKTGNLTLAKLQLYGGKYVEHFGNKFLFVSGDKNPRHSIQYLGEFYKVEIVPLVLGYMFCLYLIFIKKRKEALVLLFWALIAPIPSAVVAIGESPHAARAMFMNGSWNILIALGVVGVLNIFKRNYFKALFCGLYLISYIPQFTGAAKYYLNDYSIKYAIEWQYGMKQVVEYIKENPQYYRIFMTDVRSQPYIFFLYYLKEPLPQFRKTVIYNTTRSRSYSLVERFDNFQFANWDPIESWPSFVTLQIMTVNQYIGLRYRDWFDVKDIIYYPDKSPAFYVVSAKEGLDL